ncbi:MAG: hypothetical protein ACE148_02930 [Vicinamibacterales bacterium]
MSLGSVLFTLGAVSTLGQVVLLRELAVAFYGVELAYILALGTWLLATAAGALLPSASARRIAAAGNGVAGSDTSPPLSLLLGACAAAIPLSVVFIRASRLLLGGTPGAYLEFDRQVLAMAVALAPTGMLSGGLFRRAAGLWVTSGGSLAGAYAVESAGGLAGGLLPAAGLALGVSNMSLALAAPAIAFLLAACLARHSGRARVRVALAGAAVFAAAPVALGPLLDVASTRWSHPDLAVVRDSPYGRLAVVSRGPAIAVFTNDAWWFETEGAETEAFVHVAAIQVEPLERVLVLGGGPSGLVAEVLRHGPRSVHWVEIDRAVFDVVVPLLPPHVRGPLEDARVQRFLEDPRRFLRRAGSYDLILVGSAEPTSGEANRLYTREFFAEASRHLSPAGVVAFRLSSGEHYWTAAAAARAKGVHTAAAAAFGDVLVLAGSPNVFVASNAALVRDAEVLASRFSARRIAGRLVSMPYIRYVYDPARLAEIDARLREARAPMNTDLRPVCYQHAAVMWLSRFYPRLAALETESLTRRLHGALRLGLLFAAGAAALAFLGRSARTRWTFFAAIAGFSGMTVETVLLLDYQLKSGVVFQDIGLLLAALMAGLAIGAWMVDRQWVAAMRASGATNMRRHRDPLDRGARADGPTHSSKRATKTRRLDESGAAARRWRLWVPALMSAVSALAAAVTGIEAGVGLVGTVALLAATGSAVSMAFGYAGLGADPRFDQDAVGSGGAEKTSGEFGEIAGALYAADLAGAAVAAVVAPLVLIPGAGLMATAAWTAAAAAASIAFIL